MAGYKASALRMNEDVGSCVEDSSWRELICVWGCLCAKSVRKDWREFSDVLSEVGEDEEDEDEDDDDDDDDCVGFVDDERVEEAALRVLTYPGWALFTRLDVK